ncbi:MAG TPA: TonB-dependent receptor [Terracidiphilus sp.]|nr:TonB-dependent receptor [Terracidiphilus sp.]
MRVSRFHQGAWAALFSLLVPVFFLIVGIGSASIARSQSLTAGDLAGTVTDPTGAAVAGAAVKAVSKETGSTATTTSSATGAYRFSLLKPGNYALTFSARGFKELTATVVVTIGSITTQNVQLTVGAATETVEVSAMTQLLQTENAELNTEVSLEVLQGIPNPGGDITYVAQTAPGVVMNTGQSTSGYGNFSVYGLPGTSNNFTMNGMQVNDPFLNLNNSGPSNLLIGINDVQEVNVVTNAYGVEYGSFGGAQVNAISRSGSDKFHGNLNYYWNGRVMNANDWFFKDVPAGEPIIPRPFSISNQWGAAVGGPVMKGKTFFFFNTEGVDFITSSNNHLLLPSPAYETSVLGTDGNCGDKSSSLYANGYASQCAFYQKVFSLYNGTPNYAHATQNPSDPNQLALTAPAKIQLSEKLITARVDQVFSDKDKAFLHFKYDHGIQPTYNDPINTAFSADSDQPDWEGQLDWTHTFGIKAVNSFLITGSYYSALFVNKDPAKELATFPFEMEFLDGEFSTLNNDGLAWPEGRNVTQYQFGDDFSYNLGKHTIKAGFAFKKDLVSDHDPGILTTPLILVDAADLAAGQSDIGIKNTPGSLNLPITLYTLGFYLADDWKPTPTLTINAGIRLERNSNPDCTRNCLSNFGGDFATVVKTAPLNSASGAYNKQIKYGLGPAFVNYLAMMPEPRIGFTWTPSTTSKTVVRGGAGIFTDVFPGTIADSMLNNPPLTTSFTVVGAALGGPAGAMALNPSDPTSAQSQIAAANNTFQTGFASGGSFTSMSAANPNYSAPNFTTVADQLKYPTYLEWNLQVQHALSQSDSFQIGYVGNSGHHEPNQSQGANAFASGFGLPAAAPAPSFATVDEIESEASSNYNGLIVSYRHAGHGLTAQINYDYSHALDEISNGGILPFNGGSITYQINPNRLRDNYGNADYDVRHYISADYLYQMPHFGGPRVLTDGWQISGNVYWSSGTPFSPEALMTDYGVGNFDQGNGGVPIAPAAGTPHHCGANSAKTACLTPAMFPASLSPTPFANYERNQFFGPHYFDTDMTLMKAFKLPLGDAGKFEIGATAYNLFNHPSFANPDAGIDSASTFGQSFIANGPPTSIYGAFLGGDDSVRIVQFTGRLIF